MLCRALQNEGRGQSRCRVTAGHLLFGVEARFEGRRCELDGLGDRAGISGFTGKSVSNSGFAFARSSQRT